MRHLKDDRVYVTLGSFSRRGFYAYQELGIAYDPGYGGALVKTDLGVTGEPDEPVAQTAERSPSKRTVGGSTPLGLA
jgi:hypothetical protein